MVAQDFLIVVRTVLAAAVAMENAARWRGPERNGHFQRADRQITFQAITDGPAYDAPGVQVQDHRQIEPAFPGPDIADVSCPFLIGLIGSEIALQQVRCDVEGVITVRRRLEFTRSDLLHCFFGDSSRVQMIPSESDLT